jgi:hypothetical protein
VVAGRAKQQSGPRLPNWPVESMTCPLLLPLEFILQIKSVDAFLWDCSYSFPLSKYDTNSTRKQKNTKHVRTTILKTFPIVTSRVPDMLTENLNSCIELQTLERVTKFGATELQGSFITLYPLYIHNSRSNPKLVSVVSFFCETVNFQVTEN